jgi:hypothetical protein
MEVVEEREEDKKTALVESNAAETLKRHPPHLESTLRCCAREGGRP